MARKGWRLTETEVRKIVHLLSETDMVVGDIAERMGCSKTAVISINRRFQIRTTHGTAAHGNIRLAVQTKHCNLSRGRPAKFIHFVEEGAGLS